MIKSRRKDAPVILFKPFGIIFLCLHFNLIPWATLIRYILLIFWWEKVIPITNIKERHLRLLCIMADLLDYFLLDHWLLWLLWFLWFLLFLLLVFLVPFTLLASIPVTAIFPFVRIVLLSWHSWWLRYVYEQSGGFCDWIFLLPGLVIFTISRNWPTFAPWFKLQLVLWYTHIWGPNNITFWHSIFNIKSGMCLP